MSQITTYTLLPQTSFSQGPSVFGSPIVGPGYYQNMYNLQTFTWSLTGVTGVVHFQGTISEDSNTSDWVNIHSINAYNKTENGYVSIRGNFNWIRVHIAGFVNGTIQNLRVTY